MNRPVENDQDFFETEALNAAHSDSGKSELLTRAKAALDENPTGQLLADLKGVISYLETKLSHNSEGRDLGFEKKSFSNTELAVAMRQKPEDRLKYLLYRYRFNFYPRQKIVPDFPILLAIEPTSICNLRCVMCFQADKSFSSDKSVLGHMTMETFRRVIDEGVVNGLCAIVLASRGEPLLHRQIGEMVAYAKQRGILDVKLNTNATQLTADKSRELLRAGLDTLVFSIDSHIAEEYERIRPPAKFDRVLGNIELFHKIRKEEFPESHTRTRVSAVQLDNRQNIEEARQFWKDKVDEFANRWVIDRLNIYDFNETEHSRPCSLLWERLYVWYDGLVNTCDEDYRSLMKLGKYDGTNFSIKDLWHSSRMQEFRRKHLAGEKNSISPCDKCHGF